MATELNRFDLLRQDSQNSNENDQSWIESRDLLCTLRTTDATKFSHLRIQIDSWSHICYEGTIEISGESCVVLRNVSIASTSAKDDFDVKFPQDSFLLVISRGDISNLRIVGYDPEDSLLVDKGWTLCARRKKKKLNVKTERNDESTQEWVFPVPRISSSRYNDGPMYDIPADIYKMVKHRLQDHEEVSESEARGLKLIRKMVETGLSKHNYKQYFYFLLYAEEFDLLKNVQNYSIVVDVHKLSEGEVTFEAPSILDKTPNLQIKDKFYIVSQDCPYPAKVRDIIDYQVNAEVLEWKANSKKIFGDDSSQVKECKITFVLNKILLNRMRLALQNAKPDLISRFFPSEKKVPVKNVTNLSEVELFDKSIYKNKEQLQAVSHISAGSSGRLPYILFGPPGTGKTVTFVEAIKQVYKSKEKSTIIVTAQSNSATDLLTQKLIKDIPARDVVRIYSILHKGTYDVPGSLDDVHRFGFDWLNFKPLKKRVVCLTLSMSNNLIQHQFKASHVFIDEAAQASEPEVLISLSGILKENGHIIMSGDPHQLGPVVSSRFAKDLGLSLSPLERLMKTSLYSKKKELGYNPMIITKLLDNYRSNEAILEIPNKFFYDKELRCCANKSKPNVSNRLKWLPSKDFPIVFHHVQSRFERESPCPSIFNPAEEHQILDYVIKFRQSGIKPKDIGIITPYRRHCRNIKTRLKRDLNLHDEILVGATEQFQGQERLVMILSLARSSIDPDHFASNQIGFLDDEKRFNVSLTRAKCVQIVIGDAFLLSKNKLWNEVIKSCKHHGTFIGRHNHHKQLEFDKSFVSKKHKNSSK